MNVTLFSKASKSTLGYILDYKKQQVSRVSIILSVFLLTFNISYGQVSNSASSNELSRKIIVATNETTEASVEYKNSLESWSKVYYSRISNKRSRNKSLKLLNGKISRELDEFYLVEREYINYLDKILSDAVDIGLMTKQVAFDAIDVLRVHWVDWYNSERESLRLINKMNTILDNCRFSYDVNLEKPFTFYENDCLIDFNMNAFKIQDQLRNELRRKSDFKEDFSRVFKDVEWNIAVEEISHKTRPFDELIERLIKDGNAKDDLEDYSGAITDFTSVIELDPMNTEAYNSRGLAKHNLADYSGAISDFNKVIAIDPEAAFAYYNRGRAEYGLADYYGALADYTKAIELDPQYRNAYSNRGVVKYNLADYSGGIADFTKTIELDPEYTIGYLKRGFIKGNLEDYSGAIEDCTKAIEIDPRLLQAYLDRGNMRAFLEDYSGAIEDCTKAIELDSGSVIGYSSRGVWKEMLGNLNGACADWRKAAELGDTDAALWVAKQCK